jgi:heat shock protein HtpX
MVAVSTLMSLFGVGPYLTAQGIDYQNLMIICLLWGMGGSLVSLMLSKFMAKMFMRLEVVSPSGPYASLVHRVHAIARKAGLTKMPEVYMYQSPEVNAFATGPTRNNALVAVSTGLLQRMDDDEVEGVLAHEVAHIANGDMVTMALVQGVVNAFVLFLSRVITFAIDQAMRGNDREGRGLGFFAQIMVSNLLQIVFGILAAPVVMWFSRWREYRADEGSAQLVGKHKMIAALEALKRTYPALAKSEGSVEVMQISAKGAWSELFSSHPPLDKRIKALQAGNF